MLDAKFLVLAGSFVVLSVFMTIPHPGSVAYGSNTINGNTDNSGVDRRTHHSCEVTGLGGIKVSTHGSAQSCENFAVHSISAINTQIKMEFDASHTYLAMAAYFGRDDVAYRGFAKFFMKASEEEREHAVKLVNYLNLRGGYPQIKSIDKPAGTWEGPVEAMEAALQLERQVNSALLDLHWGAQEKNDAHLQDFLEAEFLSEQVDSIRELSGFVTVLKRLRNDNLGIHQFDEELFHGKR